MIGVSGVNIRSFWTPPIDIFVGGRPDMLSPSGATGDTTPSFVWKPVDGAVRYDLWVDEVGGAQQVIRESDPTATSFTAQHTWT